MADQSGVCQSASREKPLWGKSRGLEFPYPLAAHLLDTAAAAQVVVDKLLPPSLSRAIAEQSGGSLEEWKQAVTVLAGWHDIGKASCGFQNSDPGACPTWAFEGHDRPGAGRHDLVGAYLFWDKLSAHSDKNKYRLAQIISGHHGTIQPLDKRDLMDYGGAPLVDVSPVPLDLIQSRKDLYACLDGVLGDIPDVYMRTTGASPTLAVVVLADWIASFRPFIEAQQMHIRERGYFDCAGHHSRALDLARDHLLGCGLTVPSPNHPPTPATVLGSPSKAWRSLQASIEQNFNPTGAGIAVVCAPTGEGKTEAALIAAHKMGEVSGRHGLYFAMPTVATAEGLHERISDYIERTVPLGGSTVLRRVHSQAILHDAHPDAVPVSEEPDSVSMSARWMRGTQKSMLAPFGVGTIDQVLLGALKAKHAPLRIFGAALGCLVVDEAHALDPYMRRLLVRAVEWLAALGTPVVVLSATMPRKRVEELVSAYQRGAMGGDTADEGCSISGYPMWVAWTAADGWSGATMKSRDEWEIQFDVEDVISSNLIGQIADTAVGAAKAGRCVLVVRSTVRAAQETYEAVRRLDPSLVAGETVEIIHSRMPHGVRRHRSERLLSWLGPDNRGARPQRLVLVSTQVVEQSFDVDFDLLITDPAPVSALLQRAGRVWRHRRRPNGLPVPIKVVWPTTPRGDWHKGSPIYSKAELIAARACLVSDGTPRVIRVPDDVPDLVDRADAEGEEQFAFETDLAEEAEEATLAQLVRADQDMSEAERWAIPHPWEGDKPLHLLTGSFDTDETHPGTRHRASSVLVIPAEPTAEGLRLRSGTVISSDPASAPTPEAVRSAFDAAVPVSYPASAWADALDQLGGKWDRTPVGRALILPAGQAVVGGHVLRVSGETGLVITREGRA